MRLLADIILACHWVWLLLMVTGPMWLRWQTLALMGGFVLALNVGAGLLRMRRGKPFALICPVTSLEYALRRQAGYRGRSYSATGRLLALVGVHPTNDAVNRLVVWVLIVLPLTAWIREVLYG